MDHILESDFHYRGPRGYSNYELAVQNGYKGTESEWLEEQKQGAFNNYKADFDAEYNKQVASFNEHVEDKTDEALDILDNEIAKVTNGQIELDPNAEIIQARAGFTNLDKVLKQKIYHFSNVEEMKNCINLVEGDVVETLGYYEENDGGGATYNIRLKSDTNIEDGGSIHFIRNGLIAELIVEKISPEVFGCRGDGVTDDTANFFKLINYLYQRDRYNRIVELLPSKTYLLSQPVPINHSIQILGKNKHCNSIIKNITTDMFYVPAENCVNDNGTLKIWSYWFENVNFIGDISTNFMTGDNFQHWGTKIINCSFSSFKNIFEEIRIYASHYFEISGEAYSFGKMGGSDNLIENMIYTGTQNTENRAEQVFEFTNLYLTRFFKCFITGSLTKNRGAKNILKMTNCRDITIQHNWFDYCDCSAIFLENCNFISIDYNTIRGVSRAPEGNYIANIEIKGSKNINVIENSYLNVHQGEQNLTAKAYRIWDYSNYISENIIVKNNKFEIDYYYQLSLTNKHLTKGIVIDEPSVSNFIKTGINLIQKYSIQNSSSNGIFYYQDNYDNIFCSGTATSNTSIYVNGAYGDSEIVFTLRANKKYKAKIDDVNNDIQLALFNGSTLIRILSNDEEYIPADDIEITGVAIFINANRTYYFSKVKPQLFLIN